MHRVQVSCWCWQQVRSLREALPQFNPLIEDWWPVPEEGYDIIDQIMAEGADPSIHLFFDVETEREAELIEGAAGIALLTLSGKAFRPTVRIEGDI